MRVCLFSNSQMAVVDFVFWKFPLSLVCILTLLSPEKPFKEKRLFSIYIFIFCRVVEFLFLGRGRDGLFAIFSLEWGLCSKRYSLIIHLRNSHWMVVLPQELCWAVRAQCWIRPGSRTWGAQTLQRTRGQYGVVLLRMGQVWKKAEGN